ncbi:MAG: restriction endonuclease subunit S [Alphaproteobacteria bacterium]|nr:restriction endonuclease subunit S [Alphaproteobacteria bacterium]MBN2675264.1 restriction endonuclease subunit S [Alphaproteobacteria bacterium]
MTPIKKLQTSEFKITGKYPIIDQSQNFISGYSDDSSAVNKIKKSVIIFGDHTCSLKYIDFDFVQGADGIKIILLPDFINSKYFYYYLLGNPVDSKDYKRHFSDLKMKNISVPSLEDQEKIVAKLDAEQQIIDTNKHLIDLMKAKIAKVLNRIYKKQE